ncbi:Superoxide dismutase [Mn] [Pirellulimonas nuda]|uniref:Superoxide dismutase n=2 Tax=Pirellulimonas nuda TaxID=2528009 RepID=A0A518D5G8_9BACT|nr:superoxide dismutase [Pirellulimonas nuda]QDU86716.1 Superoxide dismutase [Mn] [Pirellulimonas nuda]
MVSRRSFLQASAGTMAAGAMFSPLGMRSARAATPFKPIELPYAFDALEPFIDARTMEIHYGKHYAGYIEKLNAAVAANPELEGMRPAALVAKWKSLPEAAQTAVRNNGGGMVNHSFFWKVMGPNAGGKPKGKVAEMIGAQLGGFDKFKADFAAAAGSRFGSGWAWLVAKGDQLQIVSTPNQDSPLTMGLRPLLGIDVWEHAYYLKYQNRRADYIDAWWNVVNWDQVEENAKSAMG